MLNDSLLNKIDVVVLVPSHGNCAYQEGRALPLMPVCAVHFLPSSALPLPEELLTNIPDYVTRL